MFIHNFNAKCLWCYTIFMVKPLTVTHINHFESFTVATMTWLTVTEVLCHNWPRICSVCRNQNPVFSSWLTYHRVCNKSNTTSVICGAGTAHSSGAHAFTPGFSGIRVARFLVFCVVICTSLFVLLSDFLFAVVSLFDLRLLITPYVSANFSSYHRGVGA